MAVIRPLLEGISAGKADKYREALKYFAFEYPNAVPGNHIHQGNANLPGLPDFQTTFYGGNYDPLTNGDLIYGRSQPHVGRDSDCYLPPRGANPNNHNRSGPWKLDNFNNAAGIGTGDAFKQHWSGYSMGRINARDLRQRAYRDYNTANFGQQNRPAFVQAQYQAYLDGMFASKFSPTSVVGLNQSYLDKHDIRKTPQQMTVVNSRISTQRAAKEHAKFYRAIRRVCKGGIAMAATSAAFVNAHVHFCLDGLGDLGNIPLKRHLGGSLPITSSELAFTCRHWNRLHNKVYFWLNGRRVHPPWERNWSELDSTGQRVRAQQETWLRYMLYRRLAQRNTQMPTFA
ncbi:MAG: hypothetical protein AAF677_10610 [Pseudomonadota bacterium]